MTEVGWFLALVHAVRGRLEEAEAVALHTYDLYRRTRNRNADAILEACLLGIRADQGRVDEILDTTDPMAAGPFTAISRACVAAFAAEAGRRALARDVMLTPADVARLPDDYFRQGAIVATAQAWWHLDAHRGATGPLISLLEPTSHLLSYPGSTGPCLGPVALALARLHGLAGDTDTARRWAERAVDQCRRSRLPTWLARADADLARITAGAATAGGA